METILEVCEEAAPSNEDRLYSSSYGGRRSRTLVCSRCKSLGSVQLFRVLAGHRNLELHKCSLVSRSGYLARVLKNLSQFKLPMDFPGGLQAFEAAVELSLENDHNVVLDPSNVAALRCAAEYLELNQGAGNVCERAESVLREALTSWKDAIEVLSSCCCDGSEAIMPLAEELFIIHRCVETLASMICGELERSWISSSSTKSKSAARTWIRDLLCFPTGIFSRIIVSCNKQGLSQKNVSQIVVKYAEKWLFSESSDFEDQEQHKAMSDDSLLEMLECIVRLLPFDQGAVPISFLFALLRLSIAIDAGSDTRSQIESRIASQLDLATIDDLLMPFKSARQAPTLACELNSMKHIVALFMSQCRAVDSTTGLANWEPVARVARVWDEYLAEAGYSGNISSFKFAELIDAVPGFVRVSHDPLYKAIHIFLKAHPTASQQEKTVICKSLDCQKLSPEACIHVGQNELMPLRIIVQAMFVQQLHTRGALRQTTMRSENVGKQEGFRYGNDLFEDLKRKRDDDQGLKADLQATNSKLESLEQQLLFIRKTLQETTQVSADHHNYHEATRRRSNRSVGQKISKAFQKMGITSGLCKGHQQVINPVERCFPMSSIHPEEADQYLYCQEQRLLAAPSRLSTSSL